MRGSLGFLAWALPQRHSLERLCYFPAAIIIPFHPLRRTWFGGRHVVA